MNLAIISHTEHYQESDGSIVGWGPTVNELNYLLEVFDTIYHVAMLYPGQPPSSSLPYISDRIIFVPIPAVGGPTLKDKFEILLKSFSVINIVNSTLKQVDYFQLRTPTGIGVFLIPYLTIFIRNKGWYKYAGNWNQERPPMGYALQRFMLKKQRRKVTINGQWPDQSNNCITFENPCLTAIDLYEGKTLVNTKSIEGKLYICYVGRLEKPKGVAHIIKSLGMLSNAEKERIEGVHLVGNGPDLDYFKALARETGVNFIFHGFLGRQEVFEIYKKSHIFLMPTTASEGFPKVIAEAMNFGCVPVVSMVSSIGQYVRHLETGICIKIVNDKEVVEALQLVFNLTDKDYQNMVTKQRAIVERFSFSHYIQRIKSELLI
ncbi:glycosyltransferase [Gelidibacter japonicus]|uniref:glycosyltransferase n=1 Tax=Gelidibacter japonicus TaxID=1962232 RepID=UPI002021B620|nr:glycosyltransferase [Gelidibacter japonicus]